MTDAALLAVCCRRVTVRDWCWHCWQRCVAGVWLHVTDVCCWSFFCSTILRSRAALFLRCQTDIWRHLNPHHPLSSRLTALACDSTRVNSFVLRVFDCPLKWCTYSAGMAAYGSTWNCCCLGAFCVHHTTVHRVTSCKATYVGYMSV